MLRGAAVVGAVLLAIVIVNAIKPDVAGVIVDALSMWSEDGVSIVRQLAAGASKVAVTFVPAGVRPHVRQLLTGATSVALVGQGLRGIPGTASPPSSATGTVAFVMAQPVDKLFYAVGGIAFEFLLLRLLVFPFWHRGYTGGAQQKTLRGFFTTHVGWLLLVASVAVPNGLFEAGFLIAFFASLPSETYTPALVVGRLLRPYVVAVLCSCPWLLHLSQRPLQWGVTEVSASSQNSFFEVAMWFSIVATALLLTARYVCAEPEGASGSAESTTGEMYKNGVLVE